MKNAKVTITFSGQLTVNLEDTGGMVDEEIKDRAMEEIAINPTPFRLLNSNLILIDFNFIIFIIY